jgi:hypothetical protein
MARGSFRISFLLTPLHVVDAQVESHVGLSRHGEPNPTR